MREPQVGHPVDARHDQDIGKGKLAAHEPGAMLCDRRVHAPAGFAELLKRTIDLLLAKTLRRTHALKQFPAHRTRIDLLALELLLVEFFEAVEERAIEGRHANGADGDFFDVMHPRARMRPRD